MHLTLAKLKAKFETLRKEWRDESGKRRRLRKRQQAVQQTLVPVSVKQAEDESVSNAEPASREPKDQVLILRRQLTDECSVSIVCPPVPAKAEAEDTAVPESPSGWQATLVELPACPVSFAGTPLDVVHEEESQDGKSDEPDSLIQDQSDELPELTPPATVQDEDDRSGKEPLVPKPPMREESATTPEAEPLPTDNEAHAITLPTSPSPSPTPPPPTPPGELEARTPPPPPHHPFHTPEPPTQGAAPLSSPKPLLPTSPPAQTTHTASEPDATATGSEPNTTHPLPQTTILPLPLPTLQDPSSSSIIQSTRTHMQPRVSKMHSWLLSLRGTSTGSTGGEGDGETPQRGAAGAGYEADAWHTEDLLAAAADESVARRAGDEGAGDAL